MYRGFDKFFGFYQGWNDYYSHTAGHPETPGYDLRDGFSVDFADNGTFTTVNAANYDVIQYFDVGDNGISPQ